MLNQHTPQHEYSVIPSFDKKWHRPANILIVDDDMDAALQVESVFSQLGCQTVITPGVAEAKRRICSLKADVIILDWFLDPFVDGGQMVTQCARSLERFHDLLKFETSRIPKIITYSGASESLIKLPESPFFQYLDHWKKPISQRELVMRALSLLHDINRKEGT